MKSRPGRKRSVASWAPKWTGSSRTGCCTGQQAQEMSGLHAVEALTSVRKSCPLRTPYDCGNTQGKEVKAHLSTIESTLAGTYQIDPTTLLIPVEGQVTSEGEVPPAPVFLLETLSYRNRFRRFGNAWIGWARSIWRRSTSIVVEERYQFLTTQEQDLSTSICFVEGNHSAHQSDDQRTCSSRPSTSCSKIPRRLCAVLPRAGARSCN